jgi:hypothetical protein
VLLGWEERWLGTRRSSSSRTTPTTSC